MATVTRESLVKRLFSDPKHYPYGFSRSGDFSINESKALSQYGCLIAALVDGVIAPQTDEDKGFIEAAFGQREPQSPAEKAWVKYQQRINRPKLGSIHGSRPAELDVDSDDTDSSSDLELSLDDD
ncbi:DUF413 domain-containing protein [Aestuariibacter halophilus]|uniref:Macrodomain Ori protein n=1 Tax=Fluctibacter halophilus TaxID=226011 RepID=A0ABS8GB89_9ALTE|nr:DUF413 domain-containing protein [Aestuariibacter halophilus]MCC2617331.1 DUF413 domain-containing protein [Aestuariibacter halophilus]